MPPSSTADLSAAGDDATTVDRDPDEHGGDETAGDDGDGAVERDPDSRPAGAEKRDPADGDDTPSTDRTTSDASDADDLTDVLDVAMNPKGSAAKPTDDAKPKDEPEQDEDDGETEDADGDEPEDEEATEEAEEEGEEKPAAEVDEDDLTEEERKRLSKATTKKIDRLLKLKPAAKLGEAIADMAAKSKFANRQTLEAWITVGGEVNHAPPEKAAERLIGMALNLHTKGQAARMPPAERAKILRELADRIAPPPPPRVIALPDDLQEHVTNGTLPKEEAEIIALKRLEKADAAERAKNPPKPKPEERTSDEDQAGEADRAYEQARAQGVSEAQKVYAKYEAKLKGPDFQRIHKEVIERVKKRATTVDPSGWAALVEDQFEAVIAKRRPATKTPPKSPPPTKTKAHEPDPNQEMSDDDLLDMVIGQKPFPKAGKR